MAGRHGRPIAYGRYCCCAVPAAAMQATIRDAATATLEEPIGEAAAGATAAAAISQFLDASTRVPGPGLESDAFHMLPGLKKTWRAARRCTVAAAGL